MGLRLVQAGRGERRDLVVIYFCAGVYDRRIRDAVGPDSIILNDTRPEDRTDEYRHVGPGGTLPLEATVARALELAGALAIRDVVIVGFSAGCKAVRALLMHAGGRRPDAVVTIDGTHALSPPEDWQIAVWERLAAEARAEQAVWIATHTAIQPPTFASTRTVLELATGWDLAPPSRRAEGGLWVWSYPGKDRAAHTEQARDVLPAALAEALRELARLRGHVGGQGGPELPGRERPANSSAPPPAGLWGAASALGRAVVACALSALAKGIAEVPPGSNRGPVVDAWLRAVGAKPPAAWCAAGTTAWLQGGAMALGVPCPVAGSAGARALGAQFMVAGRFVHGRGARGVWLRTAGIAPALHYLPGNVLVWVRGDPDDPREWRGHVGILERYADGVLHTIEPNSGPRWDEVARMQRDPDDPRLLGVGLVTTPEEAQGERAIRYQPSEHELAEAGRLMALGAEIMRDGEPADPLGPLAARLA